MTQDEESAVDPRKFIRPESRRRVDANARRVASMVHARFAVSEEKAKAMAIGLLCLIEAKSGMADGCDSETVKNYFGEEYDWRDVVAEKRWQERGIDTQDAIEKYISRKRHLDYRKL